MSLISTEHNGFSHAVCAFQIIGYFLRNFPNAVFNNNVIVVVAIVIDAVFYLVAVYILLSLCRSPLIANVGCDVDNLERSKETVLNSVFKAVCIYRLTKVANTRLVLGFFGVAVIPIWVAEEKYSNMFRQLLSSFALPL